MKNDWIDYDAALRLLRLAEVGSMPWRVLERWGAAGHVRAIAGVATYHDEIRNNEEIVPETFEHGRLSAMGGSLEIRSRDDEGKPVVLHFGGIRFSKSDLLKVLPHVPRSDAEVAIAGGLGVGMNGKPLSIPTSLPVVRVAEKPSGPPVNKGGAKRSPKWDDFVAELCITIFNDGVPDGVGTEGQEELIATVQRRLIERGFEEPLARATVQGAINAVIIRFREWEEAERAAKGK